MPTCVYCGGTHARAAEVRACWARSQRAGDSTASDAAFGQLPAPGRKEVAETPGAAAATAGATGAGRMAPVLGRSVVVRRGQAAPEAWAACDRVVADADTLDELEEAWRARRPLVIELADDPPADEVEQAPVWSLDPSFAFAGERLAHAVGANAVDVRSGSPVWPLADAAVRLGGSPAAPDGPGDVVLPDGRPAICDGGPVEFRADVDGAVVVPRLALLAGSLAPFGSNATDAELAPDQLAAVTHAGGAARIIAPAGSGKTRVLTERARHLLRRWGVPGRAVTLVAFNKRAADEMVARTGDLPELRVRTLNALGLSLVRGARTIEEREVRSILDALVGLPRRANTDPAAAWIEALSAVRLGLADPRAVEAEFGGDVDGLPDVVERYRAVLRERGVVDFDEQIYRSIETLLRDPAARERARASCRMLLVDEFQDLTPAHLLLIRLLAGPDGCVFGVGDDDQTIYGYSGASPAWLIDYRRHFPTAGEHPLEVNYRCPPTVVDAARTLLTHNRRRVAKTITPRAGRVVDAAAVSVISGDDPLAATVARVEALVASGVAPGDVAVLTRVNASLAPVQVALVHRGVAVRAAVDESYVGRGGVQAALAWLRLAVSGSGRLAGDDVMFAARRPSRALSPRVVQWMGEQRSVRDLERLAGRVGARDEKKVLGFVEDVAIVQGCVSSSPVAGSGTTADVLRAVRDRVGLDEAMQVLEGSRRRLDRSAQTDDLDALVALAALHADPHGFEAWLRSSLRRPGAADGEGVMLATIHSVKGREWPHVVVHDASAGLLPHRLAADVEEERRVFHVALTRCSSSVTVVAGDPPSPFVAELSEEWTPSRAPVRAPRPAPGVGTAASSASAASASAARRPVSLTADGERARDALRAWRLDRSRAMGKPAFVIFGDATLDELASAMPSSVVALSRIKGIGPAKLEAYGDEILAVLDSVRGA